MTRSIRIATTVALSLCSFASAQTPPGPQCVLDHDGDPLMQYLSGGDLREVEIWTGSSQTRVWIAEDGGRIRYYDSSAGVWVFQETPTSNALLDIFFLADGETGWAVGKGGVVLFTTDSGDTWTRLDTSYDPETWPTANLWGVHFLESGEGWLAGEGIFKHCDEDVFGANWDGEVIFDSSCGIGHVPGAYEFYAIDFIQDGSDIRGLAVAEPGAVFYTDDRIHWEPATCTLGDDITGPAGYDFEVWDVEFEPEPASISTARVYACGGKATGYGGIYTSTNGGLSWSTDLTDVSTETYRGATFYGIAALPSDGAVACAYGGKIRRRISSNDWADETDSEFTFPLNGVDSDGVSNLWCVGSMGHLKKSTNGGESWSMDMPTTDDEINDWRLGAISFVSESTGWLLGQFYSILKTTDGGCSWTLQTAVDPEITASYVTGMDFESSTSGVAVGFDEWMAYTTNGSTWCVTHDENATCYVDDFDAPGDGVDFMDVASAGSGDYYAVGTGGCVMRTFDGGVNWSSVTGPSGSPTLMCIDFYSATKAFVVGYTGSDIASGTGRAWRMIINPTTFAVTWEEVSPTFDGGSTVGLDGGRSLRGVDARVVNSIIEAYACGNDGVFLKYNRITVKFEPLAGVYECDSSGDMTSRLTPLRLKSVAMVPSDTKVVVSTMTSDEYPEESGRIVYFDGSSWSTIESQTTRSIMGWSFPSSSIGYGVGIGSLVETSGSIADSILVIWRP